MRRKRRIGTLALAVLAALAAGCGRDLPKAPGPLIDRHITEDPQAVLDVATLLDDDATAFVWTFRDRDDLAPWTIEGAERFRAGEGKLLGYLVGQVMGRSRGKADPRRVRDRLLHVLGGPASDDPADPDPDADADSDRGTAGR